ncbi:uncharacterized protein LACBIDRAFT_312265 [Laccaria bicolor S238N-H82]|uniref:Predicted protein n=1 Tax=Laccaria bicolor (strain S238N-H82 / ATCC MYA-4686) TaxID=486041 RepID=B0DVU8_LACBS|nr:uncharacterized protein LACBIDRAFT_312265 [Laccaria bicolor S238N-H82]EDR01362.1 predicted protein [Laccaria bicolor S238N-H82]|eukprot:XP_001888069.1 predicted protein [Laccaria bicolor S238N-H82]
MYTPTLTFNAPTGILFRHLTFSEAKKQPISDVNPKEALEVPDMSSSCLSLRFPPYANQHSKLFDLCIPLGCDYLEPIKDVGLKFPLKLIREYGAS